MKLNKTKTALLLLALTFTVNSGIAFAAPDMDGRKIGERPNPNMRPEGVMGIKNDLRVRISSTTEQRIGERREIREERNASTSEMFKRMGEKKQDTLKKMKRDTFEIRKNALVKELRMTLANLGNIRDRINTRIINIESGSTSVTEAKAALVIADEKLAKAKIAVDALANLTSTSTATTTSEVDLAKPRQIGDAAIKAIKDARDSLRDVVKMIRNGEEKDIKENN